MKLINTISDFHHGVDVLSYHCRKLNLTEGDMFITLKPICAATSHDLYSQISLIVNKHPIQCVGVIEAEKSIFQHHIQKYSDQFLPPVFYHGHLIVKNSPGLLEFKKTWVEQNENSFQAFNRKEVFDLLGLVNYISKQVNNNPSFRAFVA